MANNDYTGRTLGPYKLEQTLGRGGMASVYRAYQASVKRYVAIKVMAAEIGNDPGFVERFEREAQVIAALEHPHILPVIDYGVVDNIHYIVMRYLEGGSLDGRMRRQPLTLAECSTLLTEVASALDYAHRRGVIHRDIKPNNIMLDLDGNAYLTDFGIARMMQSDHKLTATGSVMGTPAYMSPEQGMGRSVDARSDIYTLGVVLYEMVLDQLPFKADTSAALIFQHVYERPTPPKAIKPELPDAVATVLERSIAKNPDDRFQSAGDMATAFAAAIHGKPMTNVPPSSDLQGTVVGGPMQPIIETPFGKGSATNVSPASTSSPSSTRKSSPDQPPTSGHMPTENFGTAANTGVGAKPRSVLPLIIGIVVVLVLLGIGGFAFLTVNNNNNLTSTAVAMVNQTSTAVLFTKTPTATPPETATPTLTVTPSITSSNTPTATLNATLTAQAVNSDASSTAIVQMVLNLTAAANTSTAAAISTATAAAKTATAAVNSTATSDAATAARGNQLATSTVARAMTLTANPSPTRLASTATKVLRTTATQTPVSGGNAALDDLLTTLKANGDIPTTLGTLVSHKASILQDAKDPGFDYSNPFTSSLTNFVISADIVWNAPDGDNGCGYVFRYNSPADVTMQTYYRIVITRTGDFNAYVRDKTGYRASPLDDVTSPAINTADGDTNHVVLIGVGGKFTVYVNDVKVSVFNDKTFAAGSVGLMAARGKTSSSLTCEYDDLSVYSLAAPDALSAGLTSSNFGDVLKALNDAGLAPKTVQTALTDKNQQFSLTDQNIFSLTDANKIQLTNFVMVTDVVMNTPEVTSLCGLYYHATVDDQGKHPNFVEVSFSRNQHYEVDARVNSVWANTAIDAKIEKSINVNQGDTNRLVVVMNAGNLTVFINGHQVTNTPETTFNAGLSGYFISKIDGTDEDQCIFTQTTIWKWN